MSLRDRCTDFLLDRKWMDDDALEAFVITEIGRAANEKFDDSVPLALYFATVADREEFVAAVMQAAPGMISKRWPE